MYLSEVIAMQHIFRVMIGSLFIPLFLLAQDDQATSEASLSSTTREHNLTPSKPFSVPAVDRGMEEQRKKGRQECYALHSVLSAYVNKELEGDYDINIIVDRVLNSGLGIEYTPGYPLQVISILSKNDILILPIYHENDVIEEEKDHITEALEEFDKMQEMFQMNNEEDDWFFRMAKLDMLSKLNFGF